MTPPSNNRYDRLNELSEAEQDAPLFADETWVQAPDGSWIRSTDKAARKLGRKSKGKSEPAPQPAPPPPPPAPKAEPKAEPKRRLGRSSAADRQRQADLEHQLELDRRAELERQSDLGRKAEPGRRAERERRAELDRVADLDRRVELARVTELERRAELDRMAELERRVGIERDRKAELEREADYERARAAELEREVEREHARVAELERAVEVERQRQAELTLDRGDDLASGAYWREPGSDSGFNRWPDAMPAFTGEPERRSGFGDSGITSEAVKTGFAVPEPAQFRHASGASAKPKPDHRAAHGRRSAGQRIISGATALAMVVVVLVVGAGINWLGPDPARSQRPFTSGGATGEHLDVRTFTVTVQAARAAVALQSGGVAQDTQGAWVIVRVRLTATNEPARVGYVALRDRNGRTFLATDRIRQPLLDGNRTFQPGIPTEGEVVFEVPKDALTGLTALFAAKSDRLGLDAMASVGLPGLTLATGQPAATLAPTEVKA